MSELTAYVSSIIGRPWERSRDANCWGLVAEIQSRFFDRQIPLFEFPATPLGRHRAIHRHPIRAAWLKAPAAAHGAIVLMSRPHVQRVDEHAGVCIFLPHPIILHVDEPQGVCADELPQLDLRGWSPEFYVPA